METKFQKKKRENFEKMTKLREKEKIAKIAKLKVRNVFYNCVTKNAPLKDYELDLLNEK